MHAARYEWHLCFCPRDHADVLPPEGASRLCYPTEEHLRAGREDTPSGGEPELDPAAGSRAAATIQPWRNWERRTLAHTHTHTCLTGECCVCEVGLAWGVGGRGGKVWEGCEEKCWGKVLWHIFLKKVASNRDHTHSAPRCECCDSSWCVLVAQGQARCSISQSISKNNISPRESSCKIVRLLDTHHSWSCSGFSTHFLFSLHFSFLFWVIPFFFLISPMMERMKDEKSKLKIPQWIEDNRKNMLNLLMAYHISLSFSFSVLKTFLKMPWCSAVNQHPLISDSHPRDASAIVTQLITIPCRGTIRSIQKLL